jgi:rhamnogalacturonan endolyase
VVVRVYKWALLVLVLASLAACGSSRVCDPGAVQRCPCLGGTEGVQVGVDDGTRWGTCDCGTTDADADADVAADADADVAADADSSADLPAEADAEPSDDAEDAPDGCSIALDPPTWLFALPDGSARVYLGWRLDGTHPDLGYDVFRSDAGGPFSRVNTAPITDSTNFLDTTVVDGASYLYVVRAVDASGCTSADSNMARATASATPTNQYLAIDGIQSNTWNMSMRAGDVDGDRMLDFLFRVQDGEDNCANAATQVKVYRSDGTPLWNLDTGVFNPGSYTCVDWCDWECSASCLPPDHTCSTDPRCCHGTQGGPWMNWVPWTVWDLDGDGSAEAFGLYRNGGEDVIAVRDGRTGESDGPFIPRASNDTQEFVVAYLDGTTPSLVVLSREYNTDGPSIVTAYDSAYGQLWQFSSTTDASHTLRVADLDGDGRDEILDGALAIDHDGSEMWHKSLNHTDSVFAGDVLPDAAHPGLEVIVWGETNPGVWCLRATDGAEYWGLPGVHGGGWASDVRPDVPGMEIWIIQPGVMQELHAADGTFLQDGWMAPVIEWDGDGVFEIVQDGFVRDADTLASLQGEATGNFVCALDVIGDYREELLVMREAGGVVYLRIFTNTALQARRAVSPWEIRPYAQTKQRTALHEGMGIQ